MRDSIVIGLLDLFSPLIKKAGIDYATLKVLLRYKFLVAKRSLPTLQKSSVTDKLSKIFYIIVQFCIGFVPAVFLLINSTMFVRISLNLVILLFLVVSTIISDFSWFILDIAEKNIILTKPVNDKTYAFAKTYFIVVMLFSRTFLVFIISLIVSAIKYELAFFLLLLLIYLLVLLFSYCLCNLLYAGILVYFDGEKLRDVIVGFQISLMIVFTVFYQLSGQIFEAVAKANFTNVHFWWLYILPSSWFASLFEYLYGNNRSLFNLFLGVMAIVITLVLVYLHVSYTGKILEKNLVKLNAGEIEVKPKVYKVGIITSLLLRNGVQRASYIFAKAQLKRDRGLKSSIYPSLASFLVIAIAPVIREAFQKKSPLEVISKEFFFYYAMYVFITGMISTFQMVQITSNRNAAWIYQVLPIEKPSDIKKGAYLAFVFTIGLRVFLILSIILFILVQNSPVDYLIMFFVLIFFSLLIFPLATQQMPFSRAVQEPPQQKKGTGIWFLFYMALGAALGFVHYFLLRRYKLYFLIGLIMIDVILWLVRFEIADDSEREETTKNNEKTIIPYKRW
ncbi:hypothetical protein [Anaerocellum danielii]|uniref:ABC transporter permease n=1 Tax=Anaerocellum danielii TaxID=1387557 RepID=A0ABZ0TZV9_9FIRM|nr:hypothetical protein [Caldicellulosiruptor danielii]WPX08994.1 hypothetical protein SOJ16_000161 [Caldicellulosiruptor danielii]